MSDRYRPGSSPRWLAEFAHCRPDGVLTMGRSTALPDLPPGMRSDGESIGTLSGNAPSACRRGMTSRLSPPPCDPRTVRLVEPASASHAKRDGPGGLSPPGRPCSAGQYIPGTSPGKGFNGAANAAPCCRCGSPNLDIQPCPDGLHFALARCRDCGRTRWLPTPWSIERAMAFMLHFGRFARHTIGELVRNKEGRDYLRWLAGNVGRNPGIAARIALDSLAQARSDVSQTSLQKNTPSAADDGPTGHADDALVITPEGIV